MCVVCVFDCLAVACVFVSLCACLRCAVVLLGLRCWVRVCLLACLLECVFACGRLLDCLLDWLRCTGSVAFACLIVGAFAWWVRLFVCFC